MGHQTLVEGEWFQILAAHQRENLVGVGMAKAVEPLFGDFIEEEGGGGMGDGKYYQGWQILLGGGRCEEQKRWGLGNGNYKGEAVHDKAVTVHYKGDVNCKGDAVNCKG